MIWSIFYNHLVFLSVAGKMSFAVGGALLLVLLVGAAQVSGAWRTRHHVGSMNQGLLHHLKSKGLQTDDIFTPITAEINWYCARVCLFCVFFC